ncbi:MAG: hypothetical protein IIC06_05070, partial [Proteobacteria bacterium]|nr:hypothetical protein [Pseudomonadota bacterium]
MSLILDALKKSENERKGLVEPEAAPAPPSGAESGPEADPGPEQGPGPEPGQEPSRRRIRPWVAGGAVAVAAIGAVAFFLFPGDNPTPSVTPPPAEKTAAAPPPQKAKTEAGTKAKALAVEAE